MKLALMSDLHFEHHYDNGFAFINEIVGKLPTCDVVAIAGDLGQLTEGFNETKDFLTKLSDKAEHIIYVPGNHEGYCDSFSNCVERLKELNSLVPSNVTIVDSPYQYVLYDNCLILAGTLWFPNLHALPEIKSRLNDFNYIKNVEDYIYDYNSSFKRAFLESKSDNLVCITHHSPTYESVHPKYIGRTLNQFYCNEMDDDILKVKPKAWIHGHHHDAVDFKLGETRIVSNPAGYPFEMSADWKPKVIEV